VSIKVELELDSGDFESGVVRASTTLAQLNTAASGTVVSINRLEDNSKSFLSTLRDVTTVLGLAGAAIHNVHAVTTGWVGEIIHLNAEVQKMTATLRAMSTATDPMKEALGSIKDLRKEAKETPFSLQAMHQAFVRMKSGGLDPTAGSMRALTDAVAAFGGTDETLNRAALAFQEMAGKGVVQMKELRNQLGMAVPTAMPMMARAFGVTYQELMSDVHTGTVKATEAIAALLAEMNRSFGGQGLRQMETFYGQMNRFKTIMMDLSLIAGGEGKVGGFFQTIETQFADMNNMLDGSIGKMLAGQIGDQLTGVVLSIRKVIDAAMEMRGAIVSVGTAMAYGLGGTMAINSTLGLITMIKGIGAEWALMAAKMRISDANISASWASLMPAMATLRTGITLLGTELKIAGRSVQIFSSNFMAAVEATRVGMTMMVAQGAFSFRALSTEINIAALSIRGSWSSMVTTISVLPQALSAVGSIIAGGIMPAMRSLLGIGAGVFGVLAAGAVAFAPYLPLILGGLYLINDTFDLMGNKAKDAWKDMEEYGARSAKQAKQVGDAYINDLEKKLVMVRSRPKIFRADGDLEEIQKQIDAAKEAQSGFIFSGTQADAEKSSKALIKPMLEAEQTLRLAYLQTAAEQKKRLDQETADTIAHGHSVEEVTKENQRAVRATNLKLYDDLIANYTAYQQKMREIAGDGQKSTTDRLAADIAAKEAQRRIDEETAHRAEEASRKMGVAMLPKAMKDEELFGKGTKFLEKLSADIEGAKAGIMGLDPDVANLKRSLADMKFGDENIERFKQLGDQILAAKQEADDLNTVMNSGKKIDQSLDTLLAKQAEEHFDLTHQSMSDVEKLQEKIRSGFFAGYGEASSPVAAKLVELRKQTQDVFISAEKVGNLLKNGVFGGEAITGAQTYYTAIDKIASVFERIKGSIVDANIGEAFSSIGKPGTPMFTRPNSGAQGDYYSNLYGAESSNRTNAAATTSSAQGLGQFTEGTWMQFIKTMHEDMLALGRDAVLAKRTSDPDMMKEATGWLANQNAAQLQKSGVEPTDQNVYAAHFLGATGAVDALKAPDSTMLSAIDSLTSALKANPILRPMTVGDFKDYVASKGFGTGQTWSGKAAPAVGSSNPQGLNDDESRKMGDAVANEARDAPLRVKKQLTEDVAAAEAKIAEASAIEVENNKRVAAYKTLIKEGKGANPLDRNPDADEYKEVLAVLARLDTAEEARDTRKKLRTAASAAAEKLSEQSKRADEKLKDSQVGLGSPQDVHISSEQERTKKESAPNVEKLNEDYQADLKNYQKALDQKNTALAESLKESVAKSKAALDLGTAEAAHSLAAEKDAEVTTEIKALDKKTQANVRFLEGLDESREDAFEKEKTRLSKELATYSGTEEQKLALTKKLDAYVISEQAKLNAESPLGKAMKSWTDIGQNFQSGMIASINTVADNLTTLAMHGKVKWKDMTKSMEKDMLSMLMKWSFGSVGQMGKQGASAAFGGTGLGAMAGIGGPGTSGVPSSSIGGSAGGLFGGFLAKLFGSGTAPAASTDATILSGLYHTGGLIGTTGGLNFRSASMGLFDNAPKFHTGGVVGADEVPIIARKGEGVFTQAQMAALGGGKTQHINISSPISVNANGGTPDQNNDLAQKIGDQVQQSMRNTIVQELQNQMRDGNILSSRYARQ